MPYLPEGPTIWWTGWKWDPEKQEHIPHSWKGPSLVKVSQWDLALRKHDYRRLSQMIHEEIETGSGAPGQWTPSTDPFLKNFPTINEYCTNAWYPSGKPRTVCNLKIAFGVESVLVSLNDPENERAMHTTGDSLQSCLKLMEAHISTKSPAWRDYPWKGKSKKGSGR